MNHVYTVLALDIANQRSREAADARRAALARAAREPQVGVIRRSLASGLAIVSRGSAAAARRLDDGAVEGHRQVLATGK